MSVEILLLGILVGVTLLGYMVAINSRGPTRLSISYLIATLLLAGSVWAIVQHVNSGLDKRQQAEYQQLEREKQEAEERIRSQEQTLLKNKSMMEAANKINGIISQGTGYASTMMNIDLKDLTVELNVLMARTSKMKNNIAALVKEFENLREERAFFPESVPTINDALGNLTDAVKYYRLYYRAEDSPQEELRERVLRQKARKAYDLFKKAGSQVASVH